MLKVGDLVKYTPQWSTEEECNLRFVILEERDYRNDGYGGTLHFLIKCTTPISQGSIFYATEDVTEEMIELA